MQATLVQIVLMMIGLSLMVFFGMTGGNLYAEVMSNVSSIRDRPHITVLFTSFTADDTPFGDDTEYDIYVTATLALNEQKEDIEIVPVILYKGREEKMKYVDKGQFFDTFTIKAGEKANAYDFSASIKSPLPPLKKIYPGDTIDFRENVPYYVEVNNQNDQKVTNFKLFLNHIDTKVLKKDGQDTEVCAASFIVECKNAIRISKYLAECESEDDISCIQSLELCGGFVYLTLRKADCSGRYARLDYQIVCESCIEWVVKETAIISFFKKSECVDTHEINLEQACFPDFLENKVLEFLPPS